MLNQHTSLFNYNGYITTFTHIEVDLKKPTPDMINITDIAKALSNIPHWNGQTKVPFTVAQHSVMVCWLAPDELKPLALMHDAAEAYIGDITKPLKQLLEPTITQIEARIRIAINQKYKLFMQYELVKPFDLEIQRMEWLYFFEGNPKPLVEFLRSHARLDMPDAWPHAVAEYMFLAEFEKHFITTKTPAP